MCFSAPESEPRSASYTRCASHIALHLIPPFRPRHTPRNESFCRTRQQRGKTLSLTHCATMAESDPYFQKYHECEELYEEAKYTECTELALSNLMGTCLAFQHIIESILTVVCTTKQIPLYRATSSSRRSYYLWAQRTTTGTRRRYVTVGYQQLPPRPVFIHI